MNTYIITFQPPHQAAQTAEVQATSVALALLQFCLYADDNADWDWDDAEILGVRKAEIECPECGRKYADHDTYCMYCGYIRYQAKKGY